MSELVFHGRAPSDDAWDASLRGVIDGVPYTIFYIDNIPPQDEERQYRAMAVESLPGDIVREERVYITGGFTTNVGAAIKFHKKLSQLGAVFHIDPARVDAALVPIEYDQAFADKHPGIYARIDSIDDFEVRDPDTDRLIGAGYWQSGSDDTGIVNKWTDRVRGRMDDFAYQEEGEVVAFEREVNFSPGLKGVATYAHNAKALGGSVQSALLEYDDITSRLASRRERVSINEMGEAEMARLLRDRMEDDHNITARTGVDYWVVVYDEDTAGRVSDGTESIDPEAFIVAYDGDRVVTDPSNVPRWVMVDNGVVG